MVDECLKSSSNSCLSLDYLKGKLRNQGFKFSDKILKNSLNLAIKKAKEQKIKISNQKAKEEKSKISTKKENKIPATKQSKVPKISNTEPNYQVSVTRSRTQTMGERIVFGTFKESFAKTISKESMDKLKKEFVAKCSQCHTFEGKDKTGPALDYDLSSEMDEDADRNHKKSLERMFKKAGIDYKDSDLKSSQDDITIITNPDTSYIHNNNHAPSVILDEITVVGNPNNDYPNINTRLKDIFNRHNIIDYTEKSINILSMAPGVVGGVGKGSKVAIALVKKAIQEYIKYLAKKQKENIDQIKNLFDKKAIA